MYFDQLGVIFCGKRYTGWRIRSGNITQWYTPDIIKIFWDVNSLIDYLETLGLNERNTTFGDWSSGGFRPPLEPLSNVLRNKLLHAIDQGSTKYLERMIQERISIAFYDEGDLNLRTPQTRKTPSVQGWKVNGVGLQQLEFFKVLDPYTAYQELSMWVGGVIPKNPNPMVEITNDAVKIAKHGMDKWSF